MIRVATWLLIVGFILSVVGWISLAHWIWEVVRVTALSSMLLGMVLFLFVYLRTPDPAKG